MKLTIIAATAGIGRQLLQQALAAGHDVTAVVRNPTKLLQPRTRHHRRPDRARPSSARVRDQRSRRRNLRARPHSDPTPESPAWHAGHRRGDEDHRRATHRRRQRRADQHRPARAAARTRRNTTLVTGSSCGTCSAADQAMLRKHYADLARMEDVLGERPRLDGRPAAPADRPAADRHLPHRVRAEPPARRPSRAPTSPTSCCTCSASPTRSTSHRNRMLIRRKT